jgi:hypothetical protein
MWGAWSSLLRSLTLPNGASGGTPRIVIGPDLPPELVSRGPGAALLFYISSNNYAYLMSNAAGVDFGFVDIAAGTVNELYHSVEGGGNASWVFGRNALSGNDATDVDISIGDPFGANVARFALHDGVPFAIDGVSAPRGQRGGDLYTGGAGPGSAGAEAALAAWTVSDPVTFVAGRLYRILVQGGIFDNVGTAHMANIRIRKGVNTVVGQQLCFFRAVQPAGYGAFVGEFSRVGYIANAAGADVTATLGITIERVVGGGTVSLYGDATIPLTIDVQDIGDVTDTENTSLVTAATEIA